MHRDHKRLLQPPQSSIYHGTLLSQRNRRQLGQQARRLGERSSKVDEPSLPQHNKRQSGQQVRQDRERSLRQQELPIARRQLSSQPHNLSSFRHQLGRCNVPCNFCQAEHWIDERVQGSAKSAPRFTACCESGALAMDKFEDPPQPLYSLLTKCAPCIFLFDILC